MVTNDDIVFKLFMIVMRVIELYLIR